MMDEAPHECTVIQTAAHTQLDISCFDLLTCRSVAWFQTQTWSLGGRAGTSSNVTLMLNPTLNWGYITQCHSDPKSILKFLISGGGGKYITQCCSHSESHLEFLGGSTLPIVSPTLNPTSIWGGYNVLLP